MGFKKWNLYVCAFVCFYQMENRSTRLLGLDSWLLYPPSFLLSPVFLAPLSLKPLSPFFSHHVNGYKFHLTYLLPLCFLLTPGLLHFPSQSSSLRQESILGAHRGAPTVFLTTHPWIPELPLSSAPTLLKLLLLRHPSPIPRQCCSH